MFTSKKQLLKRIEFLESELGEHRKGTQIRREQMVAAEEVYGLPENWWRTVLEDLKDIATYKAAERGREWLQ